MSRQKTAGNPLPQLTKDAPQEQVKQYFNKIMELKKSGEEFPVDLDEVWPVVYSRRDKAIATLKSDFIEGEDFLLHQLGKQKKGRGGHNVQKIFLSLPCLEYFIVKKVRPVFETYRKVTHHVMETKAKSIGQQHDHKEGVIFAAPMGGYSIKSVWQDNRQWWHLNSVVSYMGYASASKELREKLGLANTIKVASGKNETWFVNGAGVKNLVSIHDLQQ